MPRKETLVTGEPPTGPGSGPGGQPTAGHGRRPARQRGLDAPDERLRGPIDAADPRYDPNCRPGSGRRTSRAARRLLPAAGGWLVAAPFVLGPTGDAASFSDVVCGALVVVLAGALRRGAPRALGHVVALAGLWVSASVLWLDASPALGWNDFLLGAALLVLGLLGDPRRRLIAGHARSDPAPRH
jgi:hypothetical protein